MNYSELVTGLGKTIDTLSDSDLRSLNSMLVEEINARIRRNRTQIRATLQIGDTVKVNDPRCAGKSFIIEKFTAKNAVLREINSQLPWSSKIRASLGLLSKIS